MGESVEQGEQVTELVSAYDDVALAGMVLELRGRVRLLEQRVDDLSTAEQGEIEASKEAARAYANLETAERREKGLREAFDLALSWVPEPNRYELMDRALAPQPKGAQS